MPIRRFAFRKLVRDRVPDILAMKGVMSCQSTLTPGLARVWLRAKLAEETDEVVRATTTEQVKEELADVLEVVYALAQAYDFAMADIEDIRLDKLASRGGFRGLTFISHVDVQHRNPEVAYFTRRPEDFPELPVIVAEPV